MELFRKTEQVKRQAAELAETTAFLNGVLESATEYAITALDPEGRFLTWNEGARRIYGYTADEMVGRESTSRCFTPAAGRRRGQVGELLRTATRTGQVRRRLEHVRENGRRVPRHPPRSAADRTPRPVDRLRAGRTRHHRAAARRGPARSS